MAERGGRVRTLRGVRALVGAEMLVSLDISAEGMDEDLRGSALDGQRFDVLECVT